MNITDHSAATMNAAHSSGIRATAPDRNNPSGARSALRVLWVSDTDLEQAGDPGAITFIRSPTPGVEVSFLALGQPEGRSHGSSLEPSRTEHLGARGPRDLRKLGHFLRAVRHGNYDLVHSHGTWAALWGGIARRFTGTPLVATLPDLPRSEERSHRWNLEGMALRTLQRHVDRVVALSGAQWDRYVQQRLFSRALLEVVHPGVPPSLVEPRSSQAAAMLRKAAGFPPDALVAVTVSRLDERTGLDLLLWAMPAIVAGCPGIRFVLVGEGDRQHELQRRVRARGLNRFVHWTDASTDAARVIAGGDLLIHPSLRDAFPMTVVQAMAAGLPVVATRVGGVPEILGSSRVGRLVPPTNPEALANAVLELAASPSGLPEMGRAARERVRERFSADRWATSIETIYGAVVTESRAGAVRRSWPNAGLDVELLGMRHLSSLGTPPAG